MNPMINDREVREAAARWRQRNAEARARGCRCGRPATHVRYASGTVGAAAELWSCAEHVNVNGWTGSADGTYTPASDYTAADLAWISAPVLFLEEEK